MKESGSFYPQSQDGKVKPVMVAGMGLVGAALLGSIGVEVAGQLASQQITRRRFLQIGMGLIGAAIGGGVGAGATAIGEIETTDSQS